VDIHGLHTAVKSFPSTAPMCLALQLQARLEQASLAETNQRYVLECFCLFLAELAQCSYCPKVLSLDRSRTPITFLGSRDVSDIISGYYQHQIKPLGSTSMSAEICNRMQRHCDVRFGVMSQCVQASNVVKNARQRIGINIWLTNSLLFAIDSILIFESGIAVHR